MKKALRGCARLLLVAGTDEISNLDLVKDLAEVVDFVEDMKALDWQRIC